MMITVRDLSYTYPGAEQPTLFNLDFDINDGEIFGFLGPSGAGKSTTQKILIGLLRDYQGSIKVMDREVSSWGDDYFETIGVSFELPNHFLKLTALENLLYFKSLYQNRGHHPQEVLAWVGLEDEANKKVSDFSKGMKIRLNVARSLIHQPKLLFLDEPTSGLDPVNARNIMALIARLKEEGTTVFITTHNMSVADELCDRVAFITAGKLNVIDSPSILKKQFGRRSVKVEYLKRANGQTVESAEFDLDGLGQNTAYFDLLNSDVRLETIHTQETTLENIFIAVTGQELSK